MRTARREPSRCVRRARDRVLSCRFPGRSSWKRRTSRSCRRWSCARRSRTPGRCRCSCRERNTPRPRVAAPTVCPTLTAPPDFDDVPSGSRNFRSRSPARPTSRRSRRRPRRSGRGTPTSSGESRPRPKWRNDGSAMASSVSPSASEKPRACRMRTPSSRGSASRLEAEVALVEPRASAAWSRTASAR